MSTFEIIKLFIKVNLLSFGGPSIGISILEDELVKKRKIITEVDFQSIFIITNIVPGPVFIQLSYLIGKRLNGVKGIITALLVSISVVPLLSIIIYFSLEYIISDDILNNFTIYMAPIIIISITMFVYEQIKKLKSKLPINLLVIEILFSIFFIVFLKFSPFLSILIIILTIYTLGLFNIVNLRKEPFEGDND